MGFSLCSLTQKNLCLDFDSGVVRGLWYLALRLCAFMMQQHQYRNCVQGTFVKFTFRIVI